MENIEWDCKDCLCPTCVNVKCIERSISLYENGECKACHIAIKKIGKELGIVVAKSLQASACKSYM